MLEKCNRGLSISFAKYLLLAFCSLPFSLKHFNPSPKWSWWNFSLAVLVLWLSLCYCHGVACANPACAVIAGSLGP